MFIQTRKKKNVMIKIIDKRKKRKDKKRRKKKHGIKRSLKANGSYAHRCVFCLSSFCVYRCVLSYHLFPCTNVCFVYQLSACTDVRFVSPSFACTDVCVVSASFCVCRCVCCLIFSIFYASHLSACKDVCFKEGDWKHVHILAILARHLGLFDLPFFLPRVLFKLAESLKMQQPRSPTELYELIP